MWKHSNSLVKIIFIGNAKKNLFINYLCVYFVFKCSFLSSACLIFSFRSSISPISIGMTINGIFNLAVGLFETKTIK